MANEPFLDGIRLLFQPYEEPLLLPGPSLPYTNTQRIPLDQIERTRYYGIDIQIQLQATEENSVTATIFGSSLPESSGTLMTVRKNRTETRRLRIPITNDKFLALRLSVPVKSGWIRVCGTWS